MTTTIQKRHTAISSFRLALMLAGALLLALGSTACVEEDDGDPHGQIGADASGDATDHDAGSTDTGTDDAAGEDTATSDTTGGDDGGAEDAGTDDTSTDDTGGGDTGPEPTDGGDPGSPTFGEIYSEILEPMGCTAAFCHGGGSGGLFMRDADEAYDNLVEQVSSSPSCAGNTYVVPGEPGESLMLDKVTPDVEVCGEKMPLGSTGLSEEQAARIEAWIAAGAPR